jgi:hypothetical protein
MKRFLFTTAALLGAFAISACSDSVSPNGTGTLSVQLTDAPFPFTEVQSADMFVVRIDAKMAAATDAEVADATDPSGEADPSKGWVTVAEPNPSYNLLDLQGGTTVNLGQETLPIGTYRSFRLILDTDQSTVTLTDGTVLSGTSIPGIMWPSAGQSGIKIKLAQPIDLTADGTQLVLDFDLGSSFVLRGNTIMSNGLLFKPVIRATARDLTGSLSGSVHGDSTTGVAIEGATVEAMKLGSTLDDTTAADVIATTQTDASGNFHLAFLAAGSYTLRATPPAASDYTAALVASVDVTSGADASGTIIVVPHS